MIRTRYEVVTTQTSVVEIELEEEREISLQELEEFGDVFDSEVDYKIRCLGVVPDNGGH